MSTDDEKTIEAIANAIRTTMLAEIGKANVGSVAKLLFQAIRAYEETKKGGQKPSL